MMKKIILTLYFIGTITFANAEKDHHIPSYDLSHSLMQTIQDDAIIYGDGKKIIYVFIDPLCPYSRKFVTMVSKNPKMIEKYQYHLFLYSVPRLKSTDVVSAIYRSKTPMETLLDIMVEDKVQHDKNDPVTKARVDRIEKVGKELHILKRPYIFIVM